MWEDNIHPPSKHYESGEIIEDLLDAVNYLENTHTIEDHETLILLDAYETLSAFCEDGVIALNENQKQMLILNPWLDDWTEEFLGLWEEN